MGLQLSDENYRLLFEDAPFGLALCTMSGEMITVNQAFANIIGRSINETIEELKVSYWNITPKDYTEQENEQMRRLKDQGRYGPYLKEYIHKNGYTVPVQLWGGIVALGGTQYIWSSVLEIENPYQLCVFEDAPYALALSCFEEDEQHNLGDLVAVNKKFAQTLGYTVDEVLDLSYWDITPKTYEPDEKKQLKILRTKKRYGVYRKHYRHKDGDLVEVQLHGRLSQIKGRTFVWSIIEGGKKGPPSEQIDPSPIPRPEKRPASDSGILRRDRNAQPIRPFGED